ncbi:hypothetical protein PSHT_04346 [Puccinia striiformis]|uniref:Uncharacterized protein n=1 Tax=Puccinia striiformis TaxID=27350 RepID=A0A2S4WD75_9BASI|nr:hypothetical protein PSHT_04346 [Puccinia striiformis]
MVQSRSNPVNHEQDQIGCKIKLLSRQNTRANQTLGQILASRRVTRVICDQVIPCQFWAFDVTRPLRSKSGTDSKISIPKTVTAALFVSDMTKYKRTVKVDRPAIFPHEGNRSEL